MSDFNCCGDHSSTITAPGDLKILNAPLTPLLFNHGLTQMDTEKKHPQIAQIFADKFFEKSALNGKICGQNDFQSVVLPKAGTKSVCPAR